MGFRFRKPRPQVAQSDPASVAAFIHNVISNCV
jgi:hypothetical protein